MTAPALSPEQISQYDRLEEIFFNHAFTRRAKFAASGARLVHYTTAENATSIIRNQSLWLRETRCMSDFSEVHHGYRMLLEWINQPGKREQFIAALDSCVPDAGRQALKRFDDGWNHIQISTYIGCFSTHWPPKEDHYGRLSMWRAFGTRSGVALVFKMPPLYTAIPLNIYLGPVAYFTDSDFWLELDMAISRIRDNQMLLSFIPAEQLAFFAYRMLVMAIVSIKHPAFLEEQEWRLIHLPFEQSSPFVPSEVVTIGGIPQVIYKAQFKNIPEEGIRGIGIPDLFERAIIGPTQYIGSIGKALEIELADAGVPDAGMKVFASGIPLRT